jgi:hypothetical protein
LDELWEGSVLRCDEGEGMGEAERGKYLEFNLKAREAAVFRFLRGRYRRGRRGLMLCHRDIR